jgi:secreted PhoX family phosphatase
MLVTGPAAGSDRLKTSADATGTKVIGTLNNCAGGKTPWGTALIAEENFHQYFAGDPAGSAEATNYSRVGIKGEPEYPWWGKHAARFDVTKEPNEPNRFGWMVEFDPYDPNSIPKKRTALGRFKHEGANATINSDGRVVVYTGDDERFDYLYRFVTAGIYDPDNRDANMDLLDEGVLSVARFNDDGTLTWLPLVFGEGPLTPENGFKSQADVAIETRRAGDLVGATPMDRPEDVEPNPVTNVVYLALTNNSNRLAADDPEAKPGRTVDAANPRAKNSFGHIIAMTPPGAADGKADHAAETFTWDIPIMAGDPGNPDHGAKYNPDTTANGWFSAPDNVAFDSQGRLWLATDNGANWTKVGFADGIYACDVDGKGAYLTKHICRVPIGAEMCGPEFTPDDRTLFVAVQHPASDGVENSTFETPATRWPDFTAGMPPRPSVVAIGKSGGGVVGS